MRLKDCLNKPSKRGYNLRKHSPWMFSGATDTEFPEKVKASNVTPYGYNEKMEKVIHTNDAHDKITSGVHAAWYDKIRYTANVSSFEVTKIDNDWIKIGTNDNCIASRDGELYKFYRYDGTGEYAGITIAVINTGASETAIIVPQGSTVIDAVYQWAKNGEKMIAARGNTRDHIDTLKNKLGMQWSKEYKLWYGKKKPNFIIPGVRFGLIQKELVKPIRKPGVGKIDADYIPVNDPNVPKVHVAVGDCYNNRAKLKADGFKWSGSYWYRGGKKPTIKLAGVSYIIVERKKITGN
jgi:hypothetical protein